MYFIINKISVKLINLFILKLKKKYMKKQRLNLKFRINLKFISLINKLIKKI